MNVDGHVIDMSEKRGMNRFGACSQVEAYWQSLRGSELVPNRSQIDPRGIEDALQNAFILEAIGGGHARVRIAGTHLCDLLGMEVRGMPISSFFKPSSRDAFARTVKSVLESPSVMRLTLRGESGWAQPPMEAKLIMMPLRSDLGEITRILGCLETLGSIGKTPRRFELLSADKHKLEKIAEQQQLAPSSPVVESELGFSEPASEFEPSKTGKPRPGYLRLVKSDE